LKIKKKFLMVASLLTLGFSANAALPAKNLRLESSNISMLSAHNNTIESDTVSNKTRNIKFLIIVGGDNMIISYGTMDC